MVDKKVGDSLTISIGIGNNYDIDKTFAVGCSIKDANQKDWDLWDSQMIRSTYNQYGNGINDIIGEDIDEISIQSKKNATKTWTVTIPSGIAVGVAQIGINVFAHKTTNTNGSGIGQTVLKTTGWVSGKLNITPISPPSNGTIGGNVKDQYGAIVTDVDLMFERNGISMGNSISDWLGSYYVSVPAGTYKIYAMKNGYTSIVVTGIVVNSLLPTTANITLPKTATSQNGDIGGYVYDYLYNSPMRNVDIMFEQGGITKGNAITDNYGNYFITLPAGNYTVHAIKNGFNESTVSATVYAQSSTPVPNIILQAIQNGTLIIRVYDNSTGTFVQGVSVNINGALYLTKSTDGSGGVAWVVPVGNYVATLTRSGYPTKTQNVTCPSDTYVYYP